MTRETKLGLVIATSFVSLVGVVLFNALTNRTEESSQPNVVEDVRPISPDKATPTQDQTPFQVPGAVIPAAVQPSPTPTPPPSLQPAPLVLNGGEGRPMPPGPAMVPGLPGLPGLPPNNGQPTVPPGPGLAKLAAGPGEPERLWMPEVEYAPAYGGQPQPVPLADNNRPPAAPPGLDPKLLAPPTLPTQAGDPPTRPGLPGLPGDVQTAKPADPPQSPDQPRGSNDGSVTVSGITIPSPPQSPARTGNPPPAQVESHVETLVLAEPGDDLASISKKYFNSPDYAQALYAFNHDHPAQPFSDDSGMQPGGFKTKTSVYVPDVALLQKRYGQLIKASGNTAPPPPTPAPQYVSVTPLKQVPVAEGNVPPPPPMPQGGWSTPAPAAKDVVVAPPAPSPIPNPAQTANTKPYWVPAGGKYYYEIARETLGDGQRWGDIWRLNTNYPPENQIPAGAQLRLPADARVQ